MIVVFGTVALDTTRTPFKTVERILGGSATYCSISSQFFDKTGLISAVGKDFPQEYKKTLESRLDLAGFVVMDGKTFHYDSTFDYDLSKRIENKTELNVIGTYRPQVPEGYRNAEFVYLGNNDPSLNLELLQQFKKPKLTACDTIEFWIKRKKAEVLKMIENVDCVILNDDEARMIVKVPGLIKCGRKLLEMGPRFAIIKKGEHGSILFSEDTIFPVPGYPLEEIIDPTGAGDSFAGGFLGHISRKDKLNLQTLKDAVIYGNVMGSFAVEDFGIRRLLTLNMADIEARFENYRNILNF
ncbi:MAG: sugar kinase [Candidatus Aenigmarchaeota archaeon]|nr:sugar kinase [Candidatus Aenigmarchaeota archaeon]